jgi:uncharacterized protein (TIGR03086 family)
MHDLSPATEMLSRVVMDVDDDQLGAATPDGDATVADLLDHINSLSQAFAAAASKDTASSRPAPPADGSRLPPDWRVSIPQRLAALAAAWRSEPAWTGMTSVGGNDMPGEVAARVATNEVIVHGWDLAAGTGHDFAADPELVEVAIAFVEPAVRQSPDGVPGLFGPAVAVPEGAPPLHRLLGLTGRDPAWRPAR